MLIRELSVVFNAWPKGESSATSLITCVLKHKKETKFHGLLWHWLWNFLQTVLQNIHLVIICSMFPQPFPQPWDFPLDISSQ